MIIVKKSLLFLLIVMAAGCSQSKQDGLPYIDASKNYPEKEIILTDIADISYLRINSDSDDYLYSGSIRSITKNTIVIYDRSSGSVLFFSKEGNPKSRFNRRGNGPEEYYDAVHIIYDEITDDVFVSDMRKDFIQVYSSTGEYKRKITLAGTRVGTIFSIDEQLLFVYNSHAETMKNMGRLDRAHFSTEYKDSPFLLVSKTDGAIVDYMQLPQKGIALQAASANGTSGIIPTRVIKCASGLLLCNPETDTVFLYDKNKSLNPVICKTPLVDALDPMVILNNCVDVGRYQFMELITLVIEDMEFPIKYYVRDKKAGEIFRQKLLLPDYKGKEFVIGPFRSNINYENGTYFELDLLELKQAYKENKLSGKLKELVATLKDDDNNVFVMVQFK